MASPVFNLSGNPRHRRHHRESSHNSNIDTVLQPVQRPQKAHLKSSTSTQSLKTYADSESTRNLCCASGGKQFTTSRKMGLSKSHRILILLGIDSLFFLLEITVGYAVHSLALVADSFHMLNDVLSLCVGLWAVRVANTGSSKMYTYGWQRAETLGALVNGVFLVALCLSIFLEAIQRFVEPQVVSNPKLVLIVGSLGLASNIFGLFLFNDHGHSHGGSSEGHLHGDDPVKIAEEGHSHTHTDAETQRVADERGDDEDGFHKSSTGGFKNGTNTALQSHGFSISDEDNTTLSTQTNATTPKKSIASNSEIHGHRRSQTSGSFRRSFGSVDNMHIHPASFRNDIIQAARLEEQPESETDDEITPDEDIITETPNEHSKLTGSIKKSQSNKYGSVRRHLSEEFRHDSHHHAQPKESHKSHGHGGHGHSHGDLNMRGVFLHVMGDALGNIGVIGSALFIWLTSFHWRYYSDPAISLIITLIILSSAIPLCKAASRILLQAVPPGLDTDEITADIETLPGVISAHHLHVWQLSDTKLVASLHVKVDCEVVDGSNSESYMHLAREIRRCLHGYGIHSSTIQPEFSSASSVTAVDSNSPRSSSIAAAGFGNVSPKSGPGALNSKSGSLRSERQTCLLDCGDNCGSRDMCCPTGDAAKGPGK